MRKLYDLLHDVKDLRRPHGIEIHRTERVITTVEIERTSGSFLIASFGSEMPGRKKKNVYRKKRKGNHFTGVQRHTKKAKKTPPDDSGVPELVAGVSCQQPSSDSENDQSLSASRLKMTPEDYSDSFPECFDDEKACLGEGYRLVDLTKLSSTLSEAHVCKEGEKL